MLKGLSIIFAFVVVSCGATTEENSDVNADKKNSESKSEKFINVTPFKGEFTSIRSVGNKTEVSFEFKPGCTNQLGPVAHKAVKNGDKTDLFISAYKKVVSLTARCKGPTEPKTISLTGKIRKQDLNIIFLEGNGRRVPSDLSGMGTTNNLRLHAVFPAQDKSKTAIRIGVATTGCLDSAALATKPVVKNGKVQLFVHALNLGSEKSKSVKCAKQNVEDFSIIVDDVTATKEDVTFKILSGN